MNLKVATKGRGRVAIGVGLAVIGIATYLVQVATHRLFVPWYMPAMATLGVILIAASLWQARTRWRVAALLFVLLLTAGEWTFLLATRLPQYAGPVTLGKPMPVFSTLRADGGAFTPDDLKGDQNTAIFFFRGRW